MNELTDQQIALLQQAIWKLEQADSLVGVALGDSDAGQITRDSIRSAILDLKEDLDICGI